VGVPRACEKMCVNTCPTLDRRSFRFGASFHDHELSSTSREYMYMYQRWIHPSPSKKWFPHHTAVFTAHFPQEAARSGPLSPDLPAARSSLPPRHGHQDRRADLLGAALEAAQELDGTCTIQLRGAAVATAERWRSSSALLRERAKLCALPALTRRARLMHAGWTWPRGALEGRGCAHRRARDRQ
jgi:hypothetical protein